MGFLPARIERKATLVAGVRMSGMIAPQADESPITSAPAATSQTERIRFSGERQISEANGIISRGALT